VQRDDCLVWSWLKVKKGGGSSSAGSVWHVDSGAKCAEFVEAIFFIESNIEIAITALLFSPIIGHCTR
jgi:hypothetical protein